jgi:hypothetical protein
LEADFSFNVNHVEIFEEDTAFMICLLVSYPIFFIEYAAKTGNIFWFKKRMPRLMMHRLIEQP